MWGKIGDFLSREMGKFCDEKRACEKTCLGVMTFTLLVGKCIKTVLYATLLLDRGFLHLKPAVHPATTKLKRYIFLYFVVKAL